MRDFDWTILSTLRKTQNITKTAELLFVSQPTLTKRIQAIENELGVQLLVRGRHGATLTAAGDSIALKAESVIAAINEAKQEISIHNSGETGELHIGVTYSYIRYVMPKLLSLVAEKYPKVEFNILTGSSHDLVQQVEDGMLDLCLARYDADSPFLDRVALSVDQVFVVNSTPFRVEDLDQLNYVAFNRNESMRKEIRKWWGEHFNTPLTPRYMVDNGDCCMQMVACGLGFGLFADESYILSEYKDRCHSIPLTHIDGSNFTRHSYMFYRKDSYRNKTIMNFVDFVKEHFHEVASPQHS